jgi:hypothetical protein
MKNGLAIAAFAMISVALSSADQQAAPLTAPRASRILPASELFLYARKVGDKRDEIEVRTRLVSAAGENYYELRSRSPDQDLVLRLDPETLFAGYVEVTNRSKDATLRRLTTVLENRSSVGPDEVVVSTFETLPYSLRAFPWGSRQRANIRFLGSSGGSDFRFDLSVTGKETLAVGGRGVEAWKVQLSLGGILGAFFGKSYLWYSSEYPHYLVKSEGSSGGPGSPTSVLTLQSYSSEASAE